MSSLLQQDVWSSRLEVVDLSELAPQDVEPLFEEEKELWLEKLHWDISPGVSTMRRALEQRTLPGKAVRDQGVVIGYGYYLVEGERVLVGGLTVARSRPGTLVGPILVRALLAAAQSERGVRRIESQFISLDASWLRAPFLSFGFSEHGRFFFRRTLGARSIEAVPERVDLAGAYQVESFRTERIPAAAVVLHRAHVGGVDGTLNELYRTEEGCILLLQNLALQRGCGPISASASFLARDGVSGRYTALLLVTEISPAHAHLAQVAVGPEARRRGLARLLLEKSLGALARQGYRTVSLMVSEENTEALRLYASCGFQSIVRFPVFSWDRAF